MSKKIASQRLGAQDKANFLMELRGLVDLVEGGVKKKKKNLERKPIQCKLVYLVLLSVFSKGSLGTSKGHKGIWTRVLAKLLMQAASNNQRTSGKTNIISTTDTWTSTGQAYYNHTCQKVKLARIIAQLESIQQ